MNELYCQYRDAAAAGGEPPWPKQGPPLHGLCSTQRRRLRRIHLGRPQVPQVRLQGDLSHTRQQQLHRFILMLHCISSTVPCCRFYGSFVPLHRSCIAVCCFLPHRSLPSLQQCSETHDVPCCPYFWKPKGSQGKPAVVRRVLKEGPNNGRRFYACPGSKQVSSAAADQPYPPFPFPYIVAPAQQSVLTSDSPIRRER